MSEDPPKLPPLVSRNPKEEIMLPQSTKPYAKADVSQGPKIHQMQMEGEAEKEEEKGAGCCQCVVM